MGVESDLHVTKGAVKFSLLCTGGHHIGRDGVRYMAELCAIDLSAFPLYFVVVFRNEDDVRGISGEPTGQGAIKLFHSSLFMVCITFPIFVLNI